MQTLIKVVKLQVEPSFRLRLSFSDGTSGILDCTGLLSDGGPMTKPLRDPDYFGRAFIEAGAPTWPNGYDLAPWAIHSDLAARKQLHFAGHAAE